ncbi:MAG TPA: DUF1826 domain-containing protein [Kiritimatiellia bacterium]|nr:DUF1826 domain-containing protein [Kiritimatiellia bacterium]
MDQAGGLPDVLTPGVQVVVWKRQLDARVERWISVWLRQHEVSLDVTGRPDVELLLGLTRGLCKAGLPPGLGMNEFVQDVVFLAGSFAGIAGRERVRVRVDTLGDDGCMKFHVDSLRLRLLCTYAGPGTEWVANDGANRQELGNHAESMEAANRSIVPDASLVRVTPTGSVMVFKGSRFDEDPETGLVHRSHPVRSSQDIRLRLCIDEPDSRY